MSAALQGKRHSYDSASTLPEVAQKIAEWWTPERRAAKQAEMLKRNPQARYHGLSAREAARIRSEVGACEHCGATERLHIHHRDRNKHNQARSNLLVLCLSCHRAEHRGEPRKRKPARPPQ